MTEFKSQAFANAMVKIGGLGSIGVALGLVNTLVIAHHFGLTRQIEIYFVALQLYQFAIQFSLFSVSSDIFVPFYQKIKYKQGEEEASNAFCVVINWSVLLIFLVAIIFGLLSELMIQAIVPGFSKSDQQEVRVLLAFLLPLIVVNMISTFGMSLLNLKKQFGRPEVFSVFAKLTSLATIIIFAGHWGVYAVVMSLWLGELVTATSLATLLCRGGFRYRLLFDSEYFSFRDVALKFPSAIFSISSSNVYLLFLTAVLSEQREGLYAVYRYVSQIFFKLQTVLIRPITIVFYNFASEIFIREPTAVKDFSSSSLSKFLVLYCPFLAVALMFSYDGMAMVFGSEEVARENLLQGAYLISLFALLLQIDVINLIYRRTNMALGHIKSQYIASGSSLLLGAVFAFVFIPKLGFEGLLVTLVLTSFFACLFSGALVRIYAKIWYVYPARTYFRWLLSVIFASAFVYPLADWSREIEFGIPIAEYLLKIFVMCALAMLVLIFARVCGVDEVKLFERTIFQRFK